MPDSLTVVIPALNEEEAIGGTLRCCLEAAEEVKRAAGLDDVEFIVVSDGSTDRTVEIVRTFADVKLIVFERNRGYGAAIKEGFRQAQGSLVGFMDADGTCDPRWFGELCRRAIADQFDVVLGSRLGPDSQMPRVRRVGNRIFALMLGFFCGQTVTDTASGMRVLRRSALEYLYPLPDGLHFTPSMTARALAGGLRLAEVPMPYHERVGTSKLRIVEDGLRFARVIVRDVICYRPERLFMAGFAAFLLLGLLLAAYPMEFYALHRRIEDWMIYRFVVCGFLGSVGLQFLTAAAIAHRMAEFGPKRRASEPFWPPLVAGFFEGGAVLVMAGAVSIVCLVLLWPGVVEYATTFHITMHWSRFVTAVFGLMLAAQSLVAAALLRLMRLWRSEGSCHGDHR